MKEMMKNLAIMGVTAAAVGGGMYYYMQNPQAKKKAGKAVLKAMDNAENMIAKKIK